MPLGIRLDHSDACKLTDDSLDQILAAVRSEVLRALSRDCGGMPDKPFTLTIKVDVQ